MKKNCLTIAIAVFLLVCINGLQAQTAQAKLNQVELMKQSVGTWQRVISKDTVQGYEIQQYGNVFIENLYLVINGKKTFQTFYSVGFNSKEGKFKLFELRANGTYRTMIGAFTTEKKYDIDIVENFNPEKVLGKVEMVFETPTNTTFIWYNSNGEKTGEFKYFKVK